MATTYPGDPTATQAPSDPPGSGTAPQETLPADGDAANAASVAQAFKVLADFAAWEIAPFPAPGTSVDLDLKAFRNLKLQTGNFVDHWALMRGNVRHWEHEWVDAANTDKTAPGTGAYSGPWKYGIFGSDGTIFRGAAQDYEAGGGPSGMYESVVLLDHATAAGASANVLEFPDPMFFMNRATFVFEVAFMIWQPSPPPVATSSFAVGISDGNFISGASTSPIMNGAGDPTTGFFVCIDPNDSPTKLKFVTKGHGGGSSGFLSSGTWATNTVYRYTAIVVGTDNHDVSAAHVRHYINDVLMGDVAIDMNRTKVCPFIRTTSVAAESCQLVVGRPRIIAKLSLGNVRQ